MSERPTKRQKTETETKERLPNVCMIGTGEYTTGWVGSGASKSDKSAGVVGLVFFDLRRRGVVGQRVGLVGGDGTKFPAIRKHLDQAIGETYHMDVTCETFPDDNKKDYKAYISALDTFSPGDIVTIFTPDDTHTDICLAAIDRGLHVMVTKPITMNLADHHKITKAAAAKGVLVTVEVHKRYDPCYNDAYNRIQDLGDFGHFVSYMSQPQFQLETFKSWAGKSSDISYYLNSHHVDFHCWAMEGKALPVSLTAVASTGVAKSVIGVNAEDTITLTVVWKNIKSGNVGTAVYTASWAAAEADVHSQQRFFYLGHKGEISIDQAHRNYSVAQAGQGFKNINPLYMRLLPDRQTGLFCGQNTYGYMSFEVFVEAVREINRGDASPADFDSRLPTSQSTATSTAILEAGRRSLDAGGAVVTFVLDAAGQPESLQMGSA